MKTSYQADFGDDPNSGIEFQESKSLEKRLEPANPAEYVEATAQSLRDKQKKFNDIKKRFLSLSQSLERTALGLDRLQKLVQYMKNDQELQSLQEAYHSILTQNRGFSYEIDKGQRILKEVSQASEFIGKTLKNPLADRYKKVAAQQELGLRLDDIDTQFARLDSIISKMEDRHNHVVTGVEKLLNQTETAVPPAIKESIDSEAKIQEIALEYKKQIEDKAPAKPLFKKIRTDLQNTAAASKLATKSIAQQGLGQVDESTRFSLLDSTPGKLLCVLLGFVLGHLALKRLMK